MQDMLKKSVKSVEVTSILTYSSQQRQACREYQAASRNKIKAEGSQMFKKWTVKDFGDFGNNEQDFQKFREWFVGLRLRE